MKKEINYYQKIIFKNNQINNKQINYNKIKMKMMNIIIKILKLMKKYKKILMKIYKNLKCKINKNHIN